MFAPMPTTGSPDNTSFFSNSLFDGADRKDPKKVGAHFEAMFYSMMFKEMRESKLAEDPLSSSGLKQVEEMLHRELSLKLGQRGDLGIIEQLEREVKGSSMGLLKS